MFNISLKTLADLKAAILPIPEPALLGPNIKLHGSCPGSCYGTCDITCRGSCRETCKGTCAGNCKGKNKVR